MTCKMRIINNTPLQLWRVPNNTYPIRLTLTHDVTPTLFACRFKDERVTVFIDGAPHSMTRVYPSSEQWTYDHQALGSFNLVFLARYKAKRSVWGIYQDYQVTYGPAHVDVVAPPQVTVDPRQLMFYFDSDVPNTDKKTVLKNGLMTTVVVTGAAIQGDAGSLGGSGGQGFFTLVSPSAFGFNVAPNSSQDFVVRFTDSTMQRSAQLVINTSQGNFVVNLSGKYFLW